MDRDIFYALILQMTCPDGLRHLSPEERQIEYGSAIEVGREFSRHISDEWEVAMRQAEIEYWKGKDAKASAPQKSKTTRKTKKDPK